MSSDQCKIVFVHLGTKIPAHLIKNMIRVKKLWPKRDTVLITDRKVDFEGIEVFQLESGFTNNQMSASSLDSNFRQDFWRLTLSRIVALESFHKTCKNIPLLHLESDVLMFSDFPFNKFPAHSEVSWSRFNDDHDGGALIYLNNYEATQILVNRIREKVLEDPSLTDMRMLSLLRAAHAEEYSLLPTAPPEDSDAILRSPEYHDSMSAGFNHFQGIFDVAPLGMWLCGQDPRNYFGFSRRYQYVKGSAINVGNAHFRIDDEERLRFVSGDRFDFPVYTLHVHSKRLSLFECISGENNRDWVADSLTRRKSLSFSQAALKYIIIDSWRTGTTMSLILALPGLRALRRNRLLRSLVRRGMG